MAHKLAIDFGTTNSVIARWDDASGKPGFVILPAFNALLQPLEG